MYNTTCCRQLSATFQQSLVLSRMWAAALRWGVHEAFVEGKRGFFMCVVVQSVNSNILPHIATNVVCFDVIFSHGKHCYFWHGCHVDAQKGCTKLYFTSQQSNAGSSL